MPAQVTLAQVFTWEFCEFSCEFCKILKNTFLHRTPAMAASVGTLSNIYDRTFFSKISNGF